MKIRFLLEPGSSGLFAVDKPAGTLVIPGRVASDDLAPSLKEELERELGRRIFTVHRLDRDTSGVLVFALDAESHRAASMAFEAGQVRKSYLALVEGQVTAPLDIDAPLVQGRRRTTRLARPGELGKPSRTLVTPIQVFSNASFVRVEPQSGRQHQIRVHLGARGHSLLLDHQYGRDQPFTACELGGIGDEVVLARTPLHSERVTITSLGLDLHAALPDDLRRCLELLGTASSPPP